MIKLAKERLFSLPKPTFNRLYYIIKYDNIQCENYSNNGYISDFLVGLMHIAHD